MNLIRSRHKKIVKGIGRLQLIDRPYPSIGGWHRGSSRSTVRIARASIHSSIHPSCLSMQPSVYPAVHPSSQLVATPAAVQTLTETPAAQWVSGRNLDFCLLAICSCVLAVLCHQSVPAAIGSTASPITTATSPAQLDFTIKAGLFTTTQQQEAQAEDED